MRLRPATLIVLASLTMAEAAHADEGCNGLVERFVAEERARLHRILREIEHPGGRGRACGPIKGKLAGDRRFIREMRKFAAMSCVTPTMRHFIYSSIEKKEHSIREDHKLIAEIC